MGVIPEQGIALCRAFCSLISPYPQTTLLILIAVYLTPPPLVEVLETVNLYNLWQRFLLVGNLH
jgi:hypothetical protein